MPRGGVGEICIGGPGVARGYVNLPEKTADRFVTHPAAPPNGDGRLYRTGDLGRFDEDGRLVVAGREDGQVKIRGYRVELPEVEASLGSLPEIDAAAARAEFAERFAAFAAAPYRKVLTATFG